MPVMAKCTRVTNQGLARRHINCDELGPHKFCFVPRQHRDQFNLLETAKVPDTDTKLPKLPPELRRHVAKFAFPTANQQQISYCYRSYNGIQLDGTAYDQPKKIAVKNLEVIIEEFHASHNDRFSWDVYSSVHEAAKLPYLEVRDAIKKWINAKTRENPNYFSILERGNLRLYEDVFVSQIEADAEEDE